jgi:hypothetical protein
MVFSSIAVIAGWGNCLNNGHRVRFARSCNDVGFGFFIIRVIRAFPDSSFHLKMT